MPKMICTVCHRELEDKNFYTYRNGEKVEMCKSCMTMHIDNFKPETFTWLLEKMDIPYIPQEWNALRTKIYAKDPRKVNGMSVFGKYLSKMRLNQFQEYRWKDNEKIQQQYNKREAAAAQENQAIRERVRQQFQNGEISQAQYRTFYPQTAPKESEFMDPIGQDNMFNEKNFISQDELPDLSEELTLEDKQQLAIKWGRTYQISEWIQLEKTYSEMMQSFDIQDADSKNTLIVICKTYLKMNQAVDRQDIETYQKLSRVYNDLRKTMKVTAAQNKQEKGDFIDSVGQLVAYCQKNGGQIPRYNIETPYDIVDKIIDDLKEYNRSLVYEDTALARQIQDYIKEARAAAANKKDRLQAKEKGLEAPELSDQDLLDFKTFLQKEKQETQNEMKGDNDNES